MATVVLTAVGTVLGGPIGAAIGAVIGNVIDNQVLFKPKGREGARLADLQLQTSSYGTQVPKLFGTMRVAGTVIWATDLKETKSKSGGGKGRPSVTNYAYSASFAVALSARAIGQVRRIWADGNLLRGAAGDFKTEVSAFRVHGGGEDQPVDPLIAAAEGVGLTPAHRGIAYVVFEDLTLADYGNRIPSLTFEVEADAGPVPIGAAPIGRSAPRAVMGTSEAVLPEGSATLVDRRHDLLVTVLAADMDLSGADEAGLAQGRNLCLVGRELVQFETAVRTGATSYRLGGLRRGLRGTEWAMVGHEAGERFLLIEEERLVQPLAALGTVGEVGAMLRLAAVGLGDVEPVEAAIAISGEALMPPSPVHLTVGAQDGGQTFGWVRRSRAAWRWSNGGDAPMGEETERYRIAVMDGASVVRSAESGAPGWTYSAAMIAADGTAGQPLVAEVRQLGTMAQGRAARIDFTA